MSNNESPPLKQGTSWASSSQPGTSSASNSSHVCIDDDDPEMTQVMQTLRILSQASFSTSLNRPRPSNITMQTRCPTCNRITASVPGSRSREEILRNLAQLETTLASRGEELPPWVVAYKGGDSVKAAKLLHLSYIKSGKRSNADNNNSNKRVVQEATSTTTTTTTTPYESSDDKRMRLHSSSEDEDDN